MAGKVLETTVKQTSGGQFLDKTDKKWDADEEESTIVIGNTNRDLVYQKGEKFEYSEKIIFIKSELKNEKEKEKETFMLFKLKNGNSILLRDYNKLK